MDHAWTCHCCGKQFNSLPLDFGYDVPDYVLGIPGRERKRRAKLDSDFCVIDKTDFFVRGCIEIPILERDDCFAYGVWVSASKVSFERIQKLWGASVITDEPSKFGWLSNNIRGYPSTLNLKTRLHLRGDRRRPYIELEPTDHPLAVEQRQGISLGRVEQIVTRLLQGH